MLQINANLENKQEELSEEEEEYDIDQINNYKGIYYEEDTEQKFFEHDAHFQYDNLCKRLELIAKTVSPNRRGKSLYEDWPESKANALKPKTEKSKLLKTNPKFKSTIPSKTSKFKSIANPRNTTFNQNTLKNKSLLQTGNRKSSLPKPNYNGLSKTTKSSVPKTKSVIPSINRSNLNQLNSTANAKTRNTKKSINAHNTLDQGGQTFKFRFNSVDKERINFNKLQKTSQVVKPVSSNQRTSNTTAMKSRNYNIAENNISVPFGKSMNKTIDKMQFKSKTRNQSALANRTDLKAAKTMKRNSIEAMTVDRARSTGQNSIVKSDRKINESKPKTGSVRVSAVKREVKSKDFNLDSNNSVHSKNVSVGSQGTSNQSSWRVKNNIKVQKKNGVQKTGV